MKYTKGISTEVFESEISPINALRVHFYLAGSAFTHLANADSEPAKGQTLC